MEFTKPIEMPRGTHYGSNYFIVYSKKIGRTMKFYSSLEYYNFLTLEMDPLVETFCEQPYEMLLFSEGEKKKVIPDMWVRYKNGTEEFQEVKYSTELTGKDEFSLRSQEQIQREELWCRNNGIGFKVRTEKEISTGRCSIANLDFLAARNRVYESSGYDDCRSMLEETLKTGNKTVVELVENGVLPNGNLWEHLAHFFYLGIIDMDIRNEPLDGKTEVCLCRKN